MNGDNNKMTVKVIGRDGAIISNPKTGDRGTWVPRDVELARLLTHIPVVFDGSQWHSFGSKPELFVGIPS